MPRGLLSDLEIYILAAIERLGDEAYGASIHAEIEARSERPTPFGSVYVTLERLGKKGYVSFRVTAPRPTPGGRSRKRAMMTAEGRRVFVQSVRAMDRMLAGLRLRIDGSPR